MLGGLPLVVLSTDGRPVLLSRSIAEAAALPAAFHPGPAITTVLAMVPERISDARLLSAALPEQRPVERISDARLIADVVSPVPPSERVSDTRVLALGSPAGPRNGFAAAGRPFASLITQALKDEPAARADPRGDGRRAGRRPRRTDLRRGDGHSGPHSDGDRRACARQGGGGRRRTGAVDARGSPCRPRNPALGVTGRGRRRQRALPGAVGAPRLYDRLFSPGPAMPHLDGHVPQGLTTWWDWDGQGNDLLLLGMYRRWNDSFLVGIDPATGRHVGTVRVHESHLGGIGVIGDWLITQHTAGPSSRAGGAALPDRRPAHRDAGGGGHRYQAVPALRRRSPADQRGQLHGRRRGFAVDRTAHLERPDPHVPLTVDESGRLRRIAGPWKVPPRTQGLLVTPDHFLFASSKGWARGACASTDAARPGNWACRWPASGPPACRRT